MLKQVLLKSGRKVPRLRLKPITGDRNAKARLLKIDKWLVATALEDTTRGGGWIFSYSSSPEEQKAFLHDQVLAMNPSALSQADRDVLNDILFGTDQFYMDCI